MEQPPLSTGVFRVSVCGHPVCTPFWKRCLRPFWAFLVGFWGCPGDLRENPLGPPRTLPKKSPLGGLFLGGSTWSGGGFFREAEGTCFEQVDFRTPSTARIKSTQNPWGFLGYFLIRGVWCTAVCAVGGETLAFPNPAHPLGVCFWHHPKKLGFFGAPFWAFFTPSHVGHFCLGAVESTCRTPFRVTYRGPSA